MARMDSFVLSMALWLVAMGSLASPPPARATHVDHPASAARWTPALIDGRVAYVDSYGLSIRPLGEGGEAVVVPWAHQDESRPWPLDAIPMSPVGAVASDGASRVAVVLEGYGWCGPAVFALDGTLAWYAHISGATCGQPGADGLTLAVPVAAAGGHELRFFDLEDGQAASTAALPSATTTAVSRLGKPSWYGGSSSHWLVGTGSTLHVIRTDAEGVGAAAVASLDTGLAAATSVFALHAGQVGVSGRLVGEPVTSLGSALLLVDVAVTGSGAAATWSLTPHGPALTTPGPLTSPPLAVAPCDVVGGASGSSSHWFCPKGALVGAGSDWIAAWATTTQEPLFATAAAGDRVTGLALDGDGLIFHAGAQWSPDGRQLDWRLGSIDAAVSGTPASTTRMRGSSTEDAWLSSPLADASGELVVQVTGGDALSTIQMSPVGTPGLATPAHARTFGGSMNIGSTLQ